jgi:hypothetical protein
VNATRQQARYAGFLYLLVAVSAPLGLVYVPSKLIVHGDATATGDKIRAAGWLLRLGIASELVHQIIGVFLVLALYRLFKAVNETHAKLVVILGALVSVPIVFVNVLNEIAALVLLSGAEFLSVFAKPQLDALAYLFLRIHDQGITVVAIFWGLWLFPFGMLAIRSGFIPRIFGVLLTVAGFAYVVSSFTTLVLPRYASMISHIALPLEIAEVPMVFWLLIGGATTRPSTVGAFASEND